MFAKKKLQKNYGENESLWHTQLYSLYATFRTFKVCVELYVEQLLVTILDSM